MKMFSIPVDCHKYFSVFKDTIKILVDCKGYYIKTYLNSSIFFQHSFSMMVLDFKDIFSVLVDFEIHFFNSRRFCKICFQHSCILKDISSIFVYFERYSFNTRGYCFNIVHDFLFIDFLKQSVIFKDISPVLLAFQAYRFNIRCFSRIFHSCSYSKFVYFKYSCFFKTIFQNFKYIVSLLLFPSRIFSNIPEFSRLFCHYR